MTAGSLATVAFSGATVTLNDPVWEVLVNGNTDASVAPTGLVQLTTIALEVQPGAAGRVTFIQANLAGLVTCFKCDDTDDNSSDGLGEGSGQLERRAVSPSAISARQAALGYDEVVLRGWAARRHSAVQGAPPAPSPP